MFKDTCTVEKMLRSNHGTWAPLSPASWDARVTNDLCKRRHLFISRHSFIKKERNKKNGGKFDLCFLVELGFWLRQHDPFFYQVLVLGWYWTTYSLTHSINQSVSQSIKLLTHNQAHSLTHPLNLFIHSFDRIIDRSIRVPANVTYDL